MGLWGSRERERDIAREGSKKGGRGRERERVCVYVFARLCLCVNRPGMPQPVRGDKSFHNQARLHRGEVSDSGLEAYQDAFCLAKQRAIELINVHMPPGQRGMHVGS